MDPYCFVEFYDHGSAAAALAAMNKRMCLGRVSCIFVCLCYVSYRSWFLMKKLEAWEELTKVVKGKLG